MPRQIGRNSGQTSNRRDEEYAGAPERQNASAAADSLAEMVRCLSEAGMKSAGASNGGSNQEALRMLEKISGQLADLQRRSGGGSQAPRQPGSVQGYRRKNAGQQSTQQADPQREELAAIFSRLLSGGSVARDDSAQTTGGGGQSQTGGQYSRPQAAPAETAAQLLAQAQYELANELENSLEKLKKVISDSEKLADRISNLLGQENGSRQT